VHPGDGPAIVAACLSQIEQEAHAHGARTLFLIHGLTNYERVPPFLTAAQARGLPLLDLTPVLTERTPAEGTLLGADEYHWNADGHRVVAEEILRRCEPPQS
jgi:hypothetical protein